MGRYLHARALARPLAPRPPITLTDWPICEIGERDRTYFRRGGFFFLSLYAFARRLLIPASLKDWAHTRDNMSALPPESKKQNPQKIEVSVHPSHTWVPALFPAAFAFPAPATTSSLRPVSVDTVSALAVMRSPDDLPTRIIETTSTFVPNIRSNPSLYYFLQIQVGVGQSTSSRARSWVIHSSPFEFCAFRIRNVFCN